jgi:MoaA/NifB/PqqE/SkfB family radical SAM enzyme
MAAPRLGFHITNRCQLNCVHCIRDPERGAVELSPEHLENIVSQVKASLGVQDVGLTGGEPTLHARFADIADALARQQVPWSIVSNGATMERTVRMLNENSERWRWFRGAKLSLDGANAETHDAIREKGNFDRVLQAAALLLSSGKQARFAVTLNRRNIHQIEEFGLLAGQMGMTGIGFSVTHPTGTMMDQTLRVEPAQIRRAWEQIRRLSGMMRLEVSTAPGFPVAALAEPCSTFSLEYLSVDVHGRLNLCCVHSDSPSEVDPPPDIAGDLTHELFTDAWPRLLSIIHETMNARVKDVASGELDDKPWLHSPCNWCLAHHQRPHWTETGVSGPKARRERWRGAWAPKAPDPAATSVEPK